MPEKEKNDSKSAKTTSFFSLKTANKTEKIAFGFSVIFLLASVVFLVMEFIYEYETWPYSFFDLFIGLTFITDGICETRKNRTFGIINFLCGLIFLVLSILRFTSVI